MRNRIALVAAAALLAAMAQPAGATAIGVAVDALGSSTQVGSTNADGSINFYALLSGSGTYGVGGAGLSSDTCRHSASSPCGGTLDMWLSFSPVQLGSNLLSLEFSDLDLFGVNTPSYFLEAVEIFNASGVSQTVVSSLADPEVVGSQTGPSSQLLQMLINVDNNPFFIRLSFTTDLLTLGAPWGTYANTPESLLATIVAVPEPATLSLLGLGLVVIGFATRRRRRLQ